MFWAIVFVDMVFLRLDEWFYVFHLSLTETDEFRIPTIYGRGVDNQVLNTVIIVCDFEPSRA